MLDAFSLSQLLTFYLVAADRVKLMVCTWMYMMGPWPINQRFIFVSIISEVKCQVLHLIRCRGGPT